MKYFELNLVLNIIINRPSTVFVIVPNTSIIDGMIGFVVIPKERSFDGFKQR